MNKELSSKLNNLTDSTLIDRMTDDAISASGVYANSLWYEEAYQAGLNLSKGGRSFTSDDVWAVLAHKELSTPEPRALGSVFRQLQKDGCIKSTGIYTNSKRLERHHAPIRVWVGVVSR